jgi:hypothetical protein
MTGFGGFQAYQHSSAQPAVWQYAAGDWILSPSWGGLIDHHMRITDRLVDANGHRWYQIFDTTLSRGVADYDWALADTLEKGSRLVQRPEPFALSAILWRAAQCRGLKYSIPERLDCESLQRWIHTGLEQYRWCPQVWSLLAVVVGSFVIASQESKPQRRRRRVHRPR